MYLTDIHEPTLDNLIYNVRANGLNLVPDIAPAAPQETSRQCDSEGIIDREGEEEGGREGGGDTEVVVKCVNWQDPTTDPSEQADVVLGSDLVYDDNILTMLVPALSRIMKEGKHPY